MAEFMIQSETLDAIADAINAKTGGSSAMTPAQMVTEIGSISGGGDITLETLNVSANGTTNAPSGTAYNSVVVNVPVTPDYHSSKISFNVSGGTLDSTDIVYDFGNYTVSLSDFLYNTYLSQTSGSKIEIKCGKIASLYRAGGIRSGYALDTLRLTQSLTPYISTSISTSEFTRGSKIAHIVGTYFELSSPGTNVYRFFHNPNLIEVYMVPNCITTGFKMSTGALIDASIVSICNALTAASGQTITIDNAATKAKLSTIVGTVAQLSTNPVTGATETFDFFTQDAGGSTTLLDFITNTKGWTVA